MNDFDGEIVCMVRIARKLIQDFESLRILHREVAVLGHFDSPPVKYFLFAVFQEEQILILIFHSFLVRFVLFSFIWTLLGGLDHVKVTGSATNSWSRRYRLMISH